MSDTEDTVAVKWVDRPAGSMASEYATEVASKAKYGMLSPRDVWEAWMAGYEAGKKPAQRVAMLAPPAKAKKRRAR